MEQSLEAEGSHNCCCVMQELLSLSLSPLQMYFFFCCLQQILNYSSNSGQGKQFLKRLSNITVQSTLFVPDNNGLYENQVRGHAGVRGQGSRVLNKAGSTNGKGKGKVQT